MQINRIWAMPNLLTFSIKPIKEFVLNEKCGGGIWIDAFAGYFSPAEESNDLDKQSPSKFHLDALDFLKKYEDREFDGAIYDPPYSLSQARNYGHKKYSNMKYWAEIKNEYARVLKIGGKAICCGWSSNGLGLNRGFKMEKILLVAHGGSKNDTIITLEEKVFHVKNKFQE